MYLIFDTETTGLPRRGAPANDIDKWPRLVQLAWQLFDERRQMLDNGNLIIKPVGFLIPEEAANIHGITTERALREGVDLRSALETFQGVSSRASILVAHNIAYDEPVLGAEYLRTALSIPFTVEHRRVCTMISGTGFCQLPSMYGRGFKPPKLMELYEKLFNRKFVGAHDAKVDVAAGSECFFEMQDRHIL